jgi:hypothetical protein
MLANGMRPLSHEEFERVMSKRGRQPPAHVMELKEKYQARTRVAELKTSVSGVIDQEEVRAIVAMRIEYDKALEAWLLGE